MYDKFIISTNVVVVINRQLRMFTFCFLLSL